eukprot:scaffold30494_cov31-Tisochrysis_lutea.AAC.3
MPRMRLRWLPRQYRVRQRPAGSPDKLRAARPHPRAPRLGLVCVAPRELELRIRATESVVHCCAEPRAHGGEELCIASERTDGILSGRLAERDGAHPLAQRVHLADSWAVLLCLLVRVRGGDEEQEPLFELRARGLLER